MFNDGSACYYWNGIIMITQNDNDHIFSFFSKTLNMSKLIRCGFDAIWHLDGLMQERGNSIASTLDFLH